MSDKLTERQVTDAGNPAKPTGIYGARMLRRMNRSHADVTNWALDLIDFSSMARALDEYLKVRIGQSAGYNVCHEAVHLQVDGLLTCPASALSACMPRQMPKVGMSRSSA